jgi:hypothetical protein
VIFVLEWPNGEFVSFIGFILLTKSLSCNVAILTGIPYYFRSLQIFRVYFSNMEMALLWQDSASQVSRRQFQSSRKILRSFQLSKSQIPCSCLDGPMKCPDTLLCREDSDSSACISLDIRATPSGRSSVFKKNPDFLCRHGSGKTTFNHPDARSTLSRRDLNKEARYGKAVMQFTVRTLYASVWTPPRENRISVDLGLLKPINRCL